MTFFVGGATRVFERDHLPTPFSHSPISPKAPAFSIKKKQSKIEYIECSRLTCVALLQSFPGPELLADSYVLLRSTILVIENRRKSDFPPAKNPTTSLFDLRSYGDFGFNSDFQFHDTNE